MKTDGHSKVAHEAGIPRLKEALSAIGIPEEDHANWLASFYLGNWLTDTSQFKDPGSFLRTAPEKFAHFLTKIGDEFAKRFEDALCGLWDDLRSSLEGMSYDDNRANGSDSVWKEEIEALIKETKYTPKAVIAQLLKMVKEHESEWKCELICLIRKAHEAYRRAINSETAVQNRKALLDKIDSFVESLVRFSAYEKFVHPLPGTAKTRMDFPIFLEIFKRRYTQYYPHEHVDRPQCNFTKEQFCERSEFRGVQGTSDLHYANKINHKTGMYSYLEGGLLPAIGTLFDIDRKWASQYLRLETAKPQYPGLDWHMSLADLGYVLHAFEDFFAHSNYIEHVMKFQGQQFIADRVYDKKLLKDAFKGQQLSSTDFLRARKSDEAIRRLYQRLLSYFPGVDDALKSYRAQLIPDPRLKEDPYIFTGYFDGDDVLVVAFEFIIDRAKPDEQKNFIADFFTDIFEEIFDHEIRIYGEVTNKSILGKLDVKNEVLKAYLEELKKIKVENLRENSSFPDALKDDLQIIASTIFDVLIECSQVIVILISVVLRLISLRQFLFPQKVSPTDKGGVPTNPYTEAAKDLLFKKIPVILLKKGLKTFAKKELSDELYDIYWLLFEELGGNRIGSHSLMSKDVAGEPLYNEMFLCAKTVHWHIIDALCRWSERIWDERALKEDRFKWLNWEEFVFNFIRNPYATTESQISRWEKANVGSSYIYTTGLNDGTLRDIYHRRVKPTEFSYEEFLFINDYGYVVDPIAGINKPDDRKLMENLILKGVAVYSNDTSSYTIKPGQKIRIPFTVDVHLGEPGKTQPWYDQIVSLNLTDWTGFIAIYQKNRSLIEKPQNQFFDWTYLSEQDCLQKIKSYRNLDSELKNLFNTSRHTSR